MERGKDPKTSDNLNVHLFGQELDEKGCTNLENTLLFKNIFFSYIFSHPLLKCNMKVAELTSVVEGTGTGQSSGEHLLKRVSNS